jgi:hypothetical protein
MNLAGTGSFAVWVLWARERLGLAGVGFGVLVAAYTLGGLLGTAVAGRLDDRFGAAVLLRAGLWVEAGAQAPWRSPQPADRRRHPGGVRCPRHAVGCGQRVAAPADRPDRLRGRVNSVYLLFDLGGAAVGTLLGAGPATALGITAPFWLGAGGVALLALASWRRFTPAPA